MFESLSDRFDGIFGRLRGKGRLTEADVDEAMREIRLALLEADVNFNVVKNFVARVRERCLGADVSASLTPGQQVIKIVDEELTGILGGETLAITFAPKPPTVVLMAGLQGSGKTTNSAKLAAWFKSQGRHPLLIGADLQRPAAVEQLRTLGAASTYRSSATRQTPSPPLVRVSKRRAARVATSSSATRPVVSRSIRS